jgi:Flp pilus assembly protein TadB
LTKENKVNPLKKIKINLQKKQSSNDNTKTQEAPANQLEKPSALAYSLIGQKTGKFMPLFEGLDHSISKSGLKITVKAYISLTLLASLLVVFPVALVLPPVMFYVFHMSLSSVLLFGVGGAMLAWQLRFLVSTFTQHILLTNANET